MVACPTGTHVPRDALSLGVDSPIRCRFPSPGVHHCWQCSSTWALSIRHTVAFPVSGPGKDDSWVVVSMGTPCLSQRKLSSAAVFRHTGAIPALDKYSAPYRTLTKCEEESANGISSGRHLGHLAMNRELSPSFTVCDGA